MRGREFLRLARSSQLISCAIEIFRPPRVVQHDHGFLLVAGRILEVVLAPEVAVLSRKLFRLLKDLILARVDQFKPPSDRESDWQVSQYPSPCAQMR